jgi:two-component system, NarL family, invasion response regulator UvrY
MKRILIADDHAIFRQGIKDIITSHLQPVEIAEAKNTQEVIDQTFKTAWDVIILDIDLPGRNGLDAMTEIKRISPKTPVLILSGLAESEFAIRALKAGASGFASKIAELDQIIEAITKVSNGGKIHKPRDSRADGITDRHRSQRTSSRVALKPRTPSHAIDHQGSKHKRNWH